MALFRAKNTLLRKERGQMARAKRHFLPGHVWHITHRCHKKEFLLKFARDRRRWLQWLFEAKKRYGIRILNYMVTSNHIHLLSWLPVEPVRSTTKEKIETVRFGKTVIMQLLYQVTVT